MWARNARKVRKTRKERGAFESGVRVLVVCLSFTLVNSCSKCGKCSSCYSSKTAAS